MRIATMDFYSDWIGILRGELAAAGYPASAAIDDQEVCFGYFNYRERAPYARPRSVEQWAESSVPSGHEAGYKTHSLK